MSATPAIIRSVTIRRAGTALVVLTEDDLAAIERHATHYLEQPLSDDEAKSATELVALVNSYQDLLRGDA